MQTPPTPDRRSVLALSTILALAIVLALISLIFTPRFFTGQMRGSYYLWLIAGRAIPFIGAAMLLPTLIFALDASRSRRRESVVAAAFTLALAILFVVAGNRWSMQLRRVWQTDQARYYLLTDYLYLPPLNATVDVYVTACDSADRHCQSTSVMQLPSSTDFGLSEASDEDYFIGCNVEAVPMVCPTIYPLPPGTEIPVMPTPTP